jgi:signal transduction histidine kinase/CheY-like chemotaxis protein
VLVFTLQILLRQLWFFTSNLDFMEGVLIVLSNLIFAYAFFGPVLPLNQHYKFVIVFIIVILSVAMTYFYVFEKKKSFFYNRNLKNQNEWYDSIIQNMDSGFIKVKSDRIIFINKTLLNNLQNVEGFEELGENNNNNRVIDQNDSIDSLSMYSIERSLKLLLFLFKNVSFNKKELNNSEDTWIMCKTILNNNEVLSNSFKHIGSLSMTITDSSTIYYEVLGRYTLSKNLKEIYEFMFNNVSRAKMQEKLHAEFKYKTLFLSKVAHEFKNPLLCIAELVEQINDLIIMTEIFDKLKASELLSNIKAMSDYLIILIKDMDFFSQKTNQKSLTLHKENVVISKLISFCKDIAETLIRKSQKDINLKVVLINSPVSIYTDEIKLKQIIINLLSNSIKFTNAGTITLKVSRHEDGLEFEVEDTGKGITDEQKVKLFQPYFDDIDKTDNPIGAGLGLYIIKELITLLSSELTFISEVNKGTAFKFKLPYNQDFDGECSARISEPFNNQNRGEVSQHSIITEKINYNPTLNINTFFPEINSSLAHESIPRQDCIINLFDSNSISAEYKYIILVDDDVTVRKASQRLIENYFKVTINLKVLEASDGFECLYIYYKMKKKGVQISCIISDETMEYLNGSDCAQILKNTCLRKDLVRTPFFLLTAYENFNKNESGIEYIFTKPLMKNHLNIINESIIKT